MSCSIDKKKMQYKDCPPVLIMGLDGGSWTALKPAVDEGYMPFLKKVTNEGAWGTLESTIPAITPAAWGAFQTGRNPGSTGVYEFVRWDRQTQKYVYTNSTHLDKTIWEFFSESGKDVVALNLPMTYPPKKIKGIMVSGLMTPSMESEYTYPPEFKPELLNHIPDYTIIDNFNAPRKPITESQGKKFMDYLVRMIQFRTEASCFLIQKQRWDLFMVHFQATDVLQHQLWKYLDPQNPDFLKAKRDWLLSSFYGELDKRMERVYKSFREACKQEPLLLIMSDHGFESHYRRFNLFNWLSEQGYLCLDPVKLKNPFKKILKRFMPTLRWIFSDKIFYKILWKFKLDEIPVIWEKTQAFTCGCSNGEGAIYLLTQDNAERERLIQKLSKELSAIKDPQNGKAVVKKIHRREDIYSGDQISKMPDLILEPESTYSFTVQYQPKKKMFTTVKEDKILHFGKHHSDGIIAVMGPGIQQTGSLRIGILDILPTLLSYCGLPVENNLDGKVRFELFKESFHRVLSSERQDKKPDAHRGNINPMTKKPAYSAEEENMLKQRLKDLGYID